MLWLAFWRTFQIQLPPQWRTVSTLGHPSGLSCILLLCGSRCQGRVRHPSFTYKAIVQCCAVANPMTYQVHWVSQFQVREVADARCTNKEPSAEHVCSAAAAPKMSVGPVEPTALAWNAPTTFGTFLNTFYCIDCLPSGFLC